MSLSDEQYEALNAVYFQTDCDFEDVVKTVTEMLADVWYEAHEATAEWMANNPSPSGVPHDPPRNPYEVL